MCRPNRRSARPKKERSLSECQTSENNSSGSIHSQTGHISEYLAKSLLSMHETQTHKGKNSESSLKPCS